MLAVARKGGFEARILAIWDLVFGRSARLDQIVKRKGGVKEGEVQRWIDRDFPDFKSMPELHRNEIETQIHKYLEKKEYDALTFDHYGLKGTPSSIIIDKKGIVRYKLFGSSLELEKLIEPLLNE